MPPLVKHLRDTGVLKSVELERALLDTDRADFVPADVRVAAYEDTALPIGAGQTISQPYTVAFMLERLRVRSGHKVLEIGYGSGWQTALLAHLVGPQGKVCAIELVPSLCEQGRNNLEKYPHLIQRVELFCRNGEGGCLEAAPFDRIIAAAEVIDVPAAWRDQLASGGRMIYPKNGAIVLEEKNADGSWTAETFPGFAFVPFITT